MGFSRFSAACNSRWLALILVFLIPGGLLGMCAPCQSEVSYKISLGQIFLLGVFPEVDVVQPRIGTAQHRQFIGGDAEFGFVHELQSRKL